MRKYKSFSDIPTQTEYLDVLQATLQVMYFNAKESHWNAFGSGFMGIHKSFEELYEKLENYVDEIIETRMSNHDVFDSCITSFTFNSIVSQWNHQDCYLAKTVEDLTSLLNLLITNQDNLYSDLIGRITTDANHYKYIFSRYLEAKTNNENLGELVIETTKGETPAATDILDEVVDNVVPAELAEVKAYCTTKRQARCFNELVKTFSDTNRTRSQDVFSKKEIAYFVISKPNTGVCIYKYGDVLPDSESDRNNLYIIFKRIYKNYDIEGPMTKEDATKIAKELSEKYKVKIHSNPLQARGWLKR